MKTLHTHYDNLKVARDAPPEVIRAAYKTLSKKFHPDHHQNNPAMTKTFQLISAAYHVLSDPVLRQQHDAWIEKAEARLTEEITAKNSGIEKRRRSHQVRRSGDRRQSGSVYLADGFLTELPRWLPDSRDATFWLSLVFIVGLLVLFFRNH
jgi:DnaJ-class molecular chaperone